MKGPVSPASTPRQPPEPVPAPPLSVHLLHPPEPPALALLQGLLGSGVQLTMGETLPEPASFDVLVAGRPDREHLTASPNLHTLIIPWSGLPPETRELLAEFPHLGVHNLHHNAVQVAEMALALLLSAAKFLVPADRALRRHDWSPRYQPPQAVRLAGRSALVLGYGAIGRHLAHLLAGIGLRVRAVRRSITRPETDGPVAVHPAGELASLLPQAQVVMVCLPLTDETEGLLGAAELAQLPVEAVLVNVGRGPVVDEEALYGALRSGRLRAAGLDVWYNYPREEAARGSTRPSRYPFHELENVVLSPHVGGMAGREETESARMEALARLLQAAAAGGPIPNRVELSRGY